MATRYVEKIEQDKIINPIAALDKLQALDELINVLK